MSLAASDKLGPYQIIGLIGAGGMGEVYRGRDTKLGREVAIKVLPDAVAQDPERLSRFDREAKALAALNHPNVAQVYGVEESNGVRALVMELVSGTTLQGPFANRNCTQLRPPDSRRARSSARKGHRPSRSEAGQYQDHTRRRREGARFRTRHNL